MRNAPSPGLVILTVFIGLHVAGSVFAETPILDDLPPGKTGMLESPVGTYEFTTTVCGIFLEDNFEDIEIMGPGTAPNGENFYFQLSSTGNSMTISIGSEGPFDSSDRQLQAGQHVSEPFTVETSGEFISVPHITLVDEVGWRIIGDASLRINCGE